MTTQRRILLTAGVITLGALALVLLSEFLGWGESIGVWVILGPVVAGSLLGALVLVPASTHIGRRIATGALAGGIAGTVAAGLTGGGYIGLHLALGGFLNYEMFDSQWQMAVALITMESVLGAAAGSAVGLVASAFVVARAGFAPRAWHA